MSVTTDLRTPDEAWKVRSAVVQPTPHVCQRCDLPLAEHGATCEEVVAALPSSAEVLEEASRVIHGDRAEAYGPAEESFARIGALWSVYLGVPVDGYDVAMLMTLMKVSRGKNDVKRDTFVDIAGYAALAERCAVQAGRA